MTSKIQVPDHIAKEIEAEETKAKQAKESDTKDKQPSQDLPYVAQEARVLDPTLLEQSVLERMPQPTGWRMLILPYAGKGVTEDGIILVQSHVDRERLATVVGYVVKMGPDCYSDKSRFDKPWCQETMGVNR